MSATASFHGEIILLHAFTSARLCVRDLAAEFAIRAVPSLRALRIVNDKSHGRAQRIQHCEEGVTGERIGGLGETQGHLTVHAICSWIRDTNWSIGT